MSMTVQQSNDEVYGVIEFLNDATDAINNGKNNGEDYLDFEHQDTQVGLAKTNIGIKDLNHSLMKLVAVK